MEVLGPGIKLGGRKLKWIQFKLVDARDGKHFSRQSRAQDCQSTVRPGAPLASPHTDVYTSDKCFQRPEVRSNSTLKDNGCKEIPITLENRNKVFSKEVGSDFLKKKIIQDSHTDFFFFLMIRQTLTLTRNVLLPEEKL